MAVANEKISEEVLRQVKVTIVGDGAVGKTCLLHVYSEGFYPQEQKYIPTIFNTVNKKVKVGDEDIDLELHDTAGQEDYDQLRPMGYPGTSCFLLCFSVMDQITLRNIQERWLPELKKHCLHDFEILLVGTKADLRGKKTENTTDTGGRIFKEIPRRDIKKFVKSHRLGGYVETSALNGPAEVVPVFEEALRLSLRSDADKASEDNRPFSMRSMFRR